jgi:hypothetical protein
MDTLTTLDPVTQAEIDEGRRSLDELLGDANNVVVVASSAALQTLVDRLDQGVRAGAGGRFRVWAKNPAVLGKNQNVWFGQNNAAAVVLRGAVLVEQLGPNASQNMINQALLEAEAI